MIHSTDFSKELARLLKKHKKMLTGDKHGVHIIECNKIATVLESKPETSTDYFEPTLIFILKE